MHYKSIAAKSEILRDASEALANLSNSRKKVGLLRGLSAKPKPVYFIASAKLGYNPQGFFMAIDRTAFV